MSQASAEFLSPEEAWGYVRQDVFQLVAWGYQIAELEIRQRHLEEDITGLLRKAMRQKLNDLTLPSQFEFYAVHNEDPEDIPDKYGIDRPVVDITIECTRRPHKLYRLEGKRCAKNVNAIGWYAGGIQKFLDLEYAGDAPEAGLLGLVQSDNAVYWKTELVRKTKQDTRLCCEASPKDVNLTPDLPHMSVSDHRRKDGSSITLYHVFLDCLQP